MTFSVPLDEVVRENSNELLAAHPRWERVRLGDVVNVLNGFPFPSEQFSNESGTPLLRIRDVLRGETETYFTGSFDPSFIVQPGELVVGMDGDFNCARWRGESALLNQRVCKLTPNPKFLDPSFLDKVLPGYLNAINAATSSMTVKHLSSRTVADIPLPLPPRNEQGRLAEKLDELFSDLDAGVAALERARANLKRYRAAVLKAAVEGRLTEKWRAARPDLEPASRLLERLLAERRKKWEEAQLKKYAEKGQSPPKGWKDKYPEPITPDLARLPELPGGWCWATVDQLAEIQGGIQKQPSRDPRNNAYPYLRVGNVLRDRLDLDRIERFELFEGELEKLRLLPGDLLVVEGNGSKSEIGRSALWRGEIEACVHQNHIIRVRVLVGRPEYLNAYWNSPPGAARVMTQAASTSGLYTLSVGKVSNLVVPLPPLAEQGVLLDEMDSRLSLLERQAAMISDSGLRTVRLRQSILKRAFGGKLVPQDPRDEPASELLARIREARRSADRPSKRRGVKAVKV